MQGGFVDTAQIRWRGEEDHEREGSNICLVSGGIFIGFKGHQPTSLTQRQERLVPVWEKQRSKPVTS